MRLVLAFAALMTCLAQSAFAGGFYLYETGIPDVSTAFAGVAAGKGKGAKQTELSAAYAQREEI